MNYPKFTQYRREHPEMFIAGLEEKTPLEKALLAALLTLRAESTGVIDQKGLKRAQRQADKIINLVTREKDDE